MGTAGELGYFNTCRPGLVRKPLPYQDNERRAPRQDGRVSRDGARRWVIRSPAKYVRHCTEHLLYCPELESGAAVSKEYAAGRMTRRAIEPSADESALIEQAKTDHDAFGQLYDRYALRIYQYIYYRTGSEPDAEDLAAKTFMRAWQHMSNYDDRGVPFSAWLYRIAHNLVANWHRDRSRRKVISLEDLGRWQVNEDGPEASALLAEDRAALLAAVRRLPADRQELLTLKFVEHLSNAEIGSVMGRSEGAIKSLYHRTLLSLREDLQPELEAEPKESPLRRLLGRLGEVRGSDGNEGH